MDQAVACPSVLPCLQAHRVHNSPENWVRVKVHSLLAKAGGTSGATAASGAPAAATGAPPGRPCISHGCAPPLQCPAASNAADLTLHHQCMTLELLNTAAIFWCTVTFALPIAMATTNPKTP